MFTSHRIVEIPISVFLSGRIGKFMTYSIEQRRTETIKHHFDNDETVVHIHILENLQNKMRICVFDNHARILNFN